MNQLRLLLVIGLIVIFGFRQQSVKNPPLSANTTLPVHKCTDFEITGSGDNAEWARAGWNALNQLDPGVAGYDSRFKVLYSAKGIYVLFEGKDRKITTTYHNDFEDLFKADVFEVFFHPDPAVPLYFEYEINHLNKELVLLIPNLEKGFYGWQPWHYEGERKVRKMVHIEGGKSEAGASITSWRAELFIPFALLAPLQNVPPKSGMVWNANFYRLDYDSGNIIKWAWVPIAQSFHEYKKYGSIQFE
jgi:hypothetical protein